MQKATYIFTVMVALSSLAVTKSFAQEYPRWVGDIAYNPTLDDSSFQLCWHDNFVFQYFNMEAGMQYQGEKAAILAHFQRNYKPVPSNQSGWIRLRFIVNCQGQSGRFRIQQADENYQPRDFDPVIVEQIIQLTQALNGWQVIKRKGMAVDYYQYLIFKINQGEIERILP